LFLLPRYEGLLYRPAEQMTELWFTGIRIRWWKCQILNDDDDDDDQW